ncbi:MAG: hypothetical protein J1G38_01795 [Clostridiales bacterium]|nr:hypothetical protein [Clostridiales bacterium]
MDEAKEIINRLYTLRAGLSVMAHLTDKIFDRQLEFLEKLKDLSEVLSNGGEFWTNGIAIFDTPQYDRFSHYWHMNNCHGEGIAYEHNFNINDINSYVFKPGYEVFGELFKKIRFFPAFRQYVEATRGVSGDDVTREVFNITAKHNYIPAADIREMIMTWVCTDEAAEHIDRHMQMLMSYKKGLFRRPRFKKEIINLQKIIDGLPAYKERAKDLIAQRDRDIKALRTECDIIHKALQQEFDSLLDERDWKYIDYIIFALETRRVDNMKEALHYVDEEVRTNRIVNAMQQAATQICKTIIEQTSRLIAAMQICTAQLCATVEAVGARLSSKISHLTSAVELNNALIEKSSAPSEQLINVFEAARLFT